MNIKEEVDKVRWWNTIDFGNGIKSKGKIPFMCQMWNAQGIPPNLKGKSVLDIGAWDGFNSFLCEQRGATRILAIDNENHPLDGIPVKDEGFQLAKKILHSNVEYRKCDVNDIILLNEKFDIVLAFGLLYHLPNPYKAINDIYSICNELFLIESHVIPGKEPTAYFYNAYELCNDPSNWWGMTPECEMKMCRRAGFVNVKLVGFDGCSRALISAERR